MPRNSIAVQLKSSGGPVDVTTKLDYLGRLEIPYYVGVVNQAAGTLALFSGRYLSNMLSYRGSSPLRLVLVDHLGDQYRTGDDTKGYRLECPLVTIINAADGPEELIRKSRLILDDSLLALQGVVSRLNREYIFNAPGGLEIFTGKDSAQAFRKNFFDRLQEALYNLVWLVDNGNSVRNVELDAYISAWNQFLTAGLVPEEANREKLSEAIKKLVNVRSNNNGSA